jgi:hypothetical protein
MDTVGQAGGPLTVGGIISEASSLYRAQAVNLWTLVAVIVIPVQAAIVIIERLILSGGTTFVQSGTIYTTDSTGLLSIVIIVLSVLAALLTIGAMSKLLLDAYSGHPTSWRHSLQVAAGRLGPLLWLAIMTEVLLVIAFILLVIPGIYLTICWALAIPVLMFEGIGGYGALRRSRELISGHWWTTLGALLVGIIAIVIFYIVLGLILNAIANSSSHVSVILILGGISRIIAGIITYPVLASITAVIYIRLRASKENVTARDMIGAGEPNLAASAPGEPNLPPPAQVS